MCQEKVERGQGGLRSKRSVEKEKNNGSLRLLKGCGEEYNVMGI